MISFTQHPRAVGESYWRHLLTASRFGLRLLTAGLACLVHAALPFAFTSTASAMVRRLHETMTSRQ
jgi:hypothetical protein